jgi:hypothetical protein
MKGHMGKMPKVSVWRAQKLAGFTHFIIAPKHCCFWISAPVVLKGLLTPQSFAV